MNENKVHNCCRCGQPSCPILEEYNERRWRSYKLMVENKQLEMHTKRLNMLQQNKSKSKIGNDSSSSNNKMLNKKYSK